MLVVFVFTGSFGILYHIKDNTCIIKRFRSIIHREIGFFGSGMHRNRSEVENISEKSSGLGIHFLDISNGTLGDGSIEKRELLYPSYPTVCDNKKIKFIVDPCNIQEKKKDRPI